MGLAQKGYGFNGGNATMEKDEGRYTIMDIEALPEGQRAELIDGKMYMMGAPTMAHQDLLLFIGTSLYNYVKGKNGNCKPFVAPFAVYLDETSNYVEPDVLVVCDENKLDNKGCHGVPDLVVEIVSSSSVRMDYLIKLFKYRTCGVREYWIVDPSKKRIQVYDLEHEDMKEYTFLDEVPVGIYNEDLMLDFKRLSM